jgi:hypothetical protein
MSSKVERKKGLLPAMELAQFPYEIAPVIRAVGRLARPPCIYVSLHPDANKKPACTGQAGGRK